MWWKDAAFRQSKLSQVRGGLVPPLKSLLPRGRVLRASWKREAAVVWKLDGEVWKMVLSPRVYCSLFGELSSLRLRWFV